jgi:two-component system phosphate regulon response regulator PhoB
MILLIENDESIADVIGLLLEDEGLKSVRSTIKSLENDIDELQPSLIIIDYKLEHLVTGDVICKQIKANPKWSHIPIVLVSADVTLPKIASSCNAQAYIQKPFDIKPFVRTIKEVLAMKINEYGNR